jgi:hypothetical protein
MSVKYTRAWLPGKLMRTGIIDIFGFELFADRCIRDFVYAYPWGTKGVGVGRSAKIGALVLNQHFC